MAHVNVRPVPSLKCSLNPPYTLNPEPPNPNVNLSTPQLQLPVRQATGLGGCPGRMCNLTTQKLGACASQEFM